MSKNNESPANGNVIQNKMAMTEIPIYFKHSIKILFVFFLSTRKSVAPWDIPMMMIKVMSISSGM